MSFKIQDFGFPRENRLRKANDFRLCLKEKKRCFSHGFSAILRKNTLSHARLGVIISKKYFARSVDRNRIKRIAREIFRRDCHSFKGMDILILPKRQAKQLDASAWYSDMQYLWELCKQFSKVS